MDFRDSRLPPGTYANMMAQKAATSARAKSAEGSKKGATPKSGRREKAVEITPGMQDGKKRFVAQAVLGGFLCLCVNDSAVALRLQLTGAERSNYLRSA
jgi:hypothetical protein